MGKNPHTHKKKNPTTTNKKPNNESVKYWMAMKSGKSAAHQSMQNIRVPLSCPLIMGAVPLWGCSHSRELCHPDPATREGRTPHIRLLLSFRKRTNPGTWEECTLQHPCLGIVGPRISWPQPPLCLPDGLCPLPKGRGGWVGRCA